MPQKEPWTLWMHTWCSLDVVSSCTSTCIPIQEVISITVDPIQDTTHHHLIYSVWCSMTCTLPLKTAYCTNRRPPNAFGFQHIRHLGHTVHGWTGKCSQSHCLISPYKRYADDIFLHTTSEEKADNFRHTMNNPHPRLKSEIKKLSISSEGLSPYPSLPWKLHSQRTAKSSLAK